MADDPGNSTPPGGGAQTVRGGTLRLFVALYPPPGVGEQMVGVLEGVRLPRHRVTPASDVHMTLLFLGEQPAERLEPIAAAVRAAARGAGRVWVGPQSLMLLPPGRKARLVALGCHGDARIQDLYQRLVRGLGLWAGADLRPNLLPHFTLARFARGESVRGRMSLPEVEVPGFWAQEIVLVRSMLGPAGAVHTPVERSPLGA